MELRSRVVRILPAGHAGILATDMSGRIHLLDEHLQVVRSSSVVSDPVPIYGVAATDHWVVTKNKMGGISRWSLPSLDLADHIDAVELSDPAGLMPDETPSPTINRGIAIHNGRVYVNNGYLQLVVIDLETFTVLEIVESMSPDYLECICLDREDLHAVTDKKGRLFLGDLATRTFPIEVQVDDHSNLHRVRWDHRHERFWVTQDSGDGSLGRISNGVTTIDEDGQKIDSLLFATDDVEFLEFTPDQRWVYAGGFEGELKLFDNAEPQLHIERTVARFEHNIIDFVLGPLTGRLIVLTQDGRITALDPEGFPVAEANFRRQCVWDLQSDFHDPDRVLAATDEGIAELRIDRSGPRTDQVAVRLVARHRYRHGITRRVVPLEDGGWIGVTRNDVVYRCSSDGTSSWLSPLNSRLFTADVDEQRGRVLVSANEGGLELDLTDGSLLDKIVVSASPVWAAAYAPDGDRLLGGRDGVVRRISADNHHVRWETETGDESYSKRIWYADDRLWVVGGGSGLNELDEVTGAILHTFSEFLENTVEDGVAVDGFVYAVSYGQQLGVYLDPAAGKVPEALGMLEPMPDFTKALLVARASDGTPNLLVGGRGGWIRTYRLDDGVPHRVRDFLLSPDEG
ncbi:hypothetical protein [Actinopolyspora halophila]|uniref:hypothetical protein n=1 Tax=Actinopolyspora halophila TaxID=1850 RepID=UPI0003A9A25B|nr:hypothetical protein [Actinopolyspora halophila]